MGVWVGEESLLSELKIKTPSGESLTFSVNMIKESDPSRDDPATWVVGGTVRRTWRRNDYGCYISFTSTILQYLVLSSA